MPMVSNHLLRLTEALIFSGGEPVSASTLACYLKDKIDVQAVIETVAVRHGRTGFEPAAVGRGWHFQKAEVLTPELRAREEAEKRISHAAR